MTNDQINRSLEQLAWAIQASVGQFKLILAKCNYVQQRDRLIARLQEISTVKISVLALKPSQRTLYTAIREELGDDVQALMVVGLDKLPDLAQMLTSANQVREEFRKSFPFPIVLWVNDEVHQQLMQLAPDLESWATTKTFAITINELTKLIQQTASQLFDDVLNINLEIISEIKSAWQELQHQGADLTPELKADCDFLLGLVEYIHKNFDAAIEHYNQSLDYWRTIEEGTMQALTSTPLSEQSRTVTERSRSDRSRSDRQGKILTQITICYYEKAIADEKNCLQTTSLNQTEQSQTPQPEDLVREGGLRLYSRDFQSPGLSINRQTISNYLQQSIAAFAAAQRPDLIADSLDKFGIILRYLQDWQQLKTLAAQALIIHEAENNLIKISQDYGFLAETALAQNDWQQAKELAETALTFLSVPHQPAPPELSRINVITHRQSLLFILAQAQENLAQHHKVISPDVGARHGRALTGVPHVTENCYKAAINNLEAARKLGITDNDPQLYLRILEKLHSLYFHQKQYLDAFDAKQEARSIEQQFGLRAFIGAGRLQAAKQLETQVLAALQVNNQDDIAPEIAASGRQLDVERLIERIGRPDYKLIVIHGQSGVGKSSLVNAGLVPALKRKAIGVQDNLVVAIRVYTNWVEELGGVLLGDERDEGDEGDEGDRGDSSSSERDNSTFLLNTPSSEHDNSSSERDNSTFLLNTPSSEHDNSSSERDNFTFLLDTPSSEHDNSSSELENSTFLLDTPSSKPQTPHSPSSSSSPSSPSSLALLTQLKENEQRNLRTVLIFDQFEEFFFVYPEPKQRRQFFEFLGECLNILSVKVILSLRMDYLHYLLECNRLSSLKIIGNDILSKNVLYELGNFSPDDTKSIIQRLTAKTTFYLEPTLIDKLVQDLAGELGEVRPIELQVVGAQLQTESITTLAKYQELGSNAKEELVKRYLAEVVDDCGVENQQAAELLLYLLTDEKGTRPLKTRAEIERDLQALLADVTTDSNKLDLILEIFVKSGLVVLLPENPADRYQLVHDYLAAFIRQQQEPKLKQVMAELEEERKQRKISEKQRKISEAKLNSFLKRALMGSVAAGLVLAGLAVTAWDAAKRAENQKKQADVSEINAITNSSEALFLSGLNFDALIEGLKAGENLKSAELATPSTRMQTIATLRQAVYLQPDENKFRELNSLEGHSSPVYSVCFSPDGKTIATASGDRTVKLWDISGKQLKTFQGHSGAVRGVSFSPDGKTIATASLDSTVKLWDISGKQLKTLKGHSGWVSSVSFSPDGKTIATASDDGTVKLWEISGKLLKTLQGYSGGVLGVSFSPDGKTIATANGDTTVKLWEISGKLLKTLKGHSNAVRGVSFSPDGKTIATASDDTTVKLWDISGKQLKTLQGHSNAVRGVSFSPDGKTIATASLDTTVKLWDISSKQLKTLKGHSGAVLGVSFSPDGKTIATASADSTVKLWDISGKLLKTLNGHSNAVWGVSFSPDGKTIATASTDTTVKLWDISGKLLKTLKGHSNAVWGVSFSPDGKTIATASVDSTVILWDLDLDNLLASGCQRLNNYLPTHADVLEDLKACQTPAIKKAAAPALVAQGEELARTENINLAVSKFRQALEWNPSLKLDPQTKAKQLAEASALVAKGEKLAQESKLEDAVANFQQALQLDSSLDFKPKTKAAALLVESGASLVREDKFKEALAAYTNAQKFDPKVEISADDWHTLCRKGSLQKQVADVMFACNQAVKLAPNDGNIRDSRGLARALTGDYPGAIADFEDYIAQTDDKDIKAQRQSWVKDLKAGKNPITDDELKRLRN
ncbi:sigma-54 interacting domain-containing protein [Calothrix sp. PCC 7507]|uniref:WD40 repeat domain-containing protein n=1 Tax=Calothrix sp. PCC 7507 TaxID=99598 RepID=UPI00029EE8D6|nr:sigma-54 interacting domain-containing protein [Calothrix sp. PCC 7507]AFY33697.1 Sigma 54 interacting domain protein [Calothrix sp. PCC 7507]